MKLEASADPPVRVFVGADRSQIIGVRVLEYSIRRHTSVQVELTPMVDLPLPEPPEPRHHARTGFSFSRFAIPMLANYRGRALYLDADMLVFRDIMDLWSMPFGEAKAICQTEIPKPFQKFKGHVEIHEIADQADVCNAVGLRSAGLEGGGYYCRAWTALFV